MAILSRSLSKMSLAAEPITTISHSKMVYFLLPADKLPVPEESICFRLLSGLEFRFLEHLYPFLFPSWF